IMLRNAIGKVAARDGMVAIPATMRLPLISEEGFINRNARYHPALNLLAGRDRKAFRLTLQDEDRWTTMGGESRRKKHGASSTVRPPAADFNSEASVRAEDCLDICSQLRGSSPACAPGLHHDDGPERMAPISASLQVRSPASAYRPRVKEAVPCQRGYGQ